MINKIARICWNENNWKKPSGAYGKSETKGLFEAENKFGFEEWIFNFDTLIDGYKYAFLQPINTKNKIHAGRQYNIFLYAYDSFSEQNVLVAKIDNVYCLLESEANVLYSKMKKNLVLDEMIRDVCDIQGNDILLKTLSPINCFNIRFKPQDLKYLSIQNFHSLHNLTRYNLYEDVDQLENLHVDLCSDDYLLDDVTKIISSDISDTEKEVQIKARLGQGRFRKNVIQVWGSEVCALTLNPIRDVLVASHIKAWKDCASAEERLDGANGILLEATLDKLFDLHLMTLFATRKNEYEINYSPKIIDRLPKYYKELSGYCIRTMQMSDCESSRFSEYIKYHNDLYLAKCKE